MLSDEKLLDLIYNAAICYILTQELDNEQLEKLDNIRYQWCKCKRCERELKIGSKVIIPQYAGHANKKKWEISVSRPFLGSLRNFHTQCFCISSEALPCMR